MSSTKVLLLGWFEQYCAVKDACSASGDWSKYAEMFEKDAFVDHHGFGRFEGREGIARYITQSIAPFGTMSFPIDWVAVDEKNSAIVFQVQNAFPTPPVNPETGLAFQFPNWTRLTFNEKGRVLSEETVYNPERDAKRTFKQWSAAGGKFHTKEQLKYKYSIYPKL